MLFFIAAATAVLIIGGCSSEETKQKNKYDPAIKQVLKLENEDLKKPGVQKDIDTLKRQNTKVEVFENGKYIKLTYEIRKSDFAKPVFERDPDGVYSQTSSTVIDGKKSIYTENKEIGSE